MISEPGARTNITAILTSASLTPSRWILRPLLKPSWKLEAEKSRKGEGAQINLNKFPTPYPAMGICTLRQAPPFGDPFDKLRGAFAGRCSGWGFP